MSHYQFAREQISTYALNRLVFASGCPMNLLRSLTYLCAFSAVVACSQPQPQEVQPDLSGVTPWSEVPVDSIRVPEGVLYQLATVGGATVAQISGVPDAALSAGLTDGVSIKLPEGVEQQASGARVQIVVRASSSSDDGLLGVAYSTNDVGNSGWQRFRLSTRPRDYVFTYSAPLLQEGGGDYIGFRSYGDGTVYVWGYHVEMIDLGLDPSLRMQTQ